jgi:folate-binding protein YgfZ
LFRHDFCGLPGLQIAGPSDTVAALGQQLESTAASTGLRAIGFDAVEALRIEAGIPVYPHEINEDVLPAETGQLERAVSFQKGCYLGQEVVERMRAHKSLGKQLVGLRLESQAPPGSPITIAAPSQSEREEEGRGGGASPSPSKGEGRGEGTVIGKLTSVCRSPALDAMIGLAYIRVAHSAPGTQVQMTPQDAAPITARVTPLPFPHP